MIESARGGEPRSPASSPLAFLASPTPGQSPQPLERPTLPTRAQRLVLDCHHLSIRPWPDPVLDQLGHDPRSPYVERFWLSVLGPSVTWFVRYLAERFDAAPDGFDLDLGSCAAALGLGSTKGRAMAFPRAIARSCQFRAARWLDEATLEVRRKLPPLNNRQVAKLPEPLRLEHARWMTMPSPVPGGPTMPPGIGETSAPHALSDQARRLALSLVQLGEDRTRVGQQLARWRFPSELVRSATTWAFDHTAHPTTE